MIRWVKALYYRLRYPWAFRNLWVKKPYNVERVGGNLHIWNQDSVCVQSVFDDENVGV